MADIEKIREHFADIWNCEIDHSIFQDRVSEIVEKTVEMVEQERRWIPVDERKPEHHEFVILTGIEAINNKRVYAIKCWDRDTWRPCNSAPSINWDYWHKLPTPPKDGDLDG